MYEIRVNGKTKESAETLSAAAQVLRDLGYEQEAATISGGQSAK